MVCFPEPYATGGGWFPLTMPLDPKKIVEDARKVGLIGFAGPVTLPPPKPAKVDRRKHKRTLRGAYKARYVIHPNSRPDLFQ